MMETPEKPSLYDVLKKLTNALQLIEYNDEKNYYEIYFEDYSRGETSIYLNYDLDPSPNEKKAELVRHIHAKMRPYVSNRFFDFTMLLKFYQVLEGEDTL
ncbi:MAG: hypothetical protein PHO46_07180 [Thermoguttaceae bacterium]|jgi:hypothetical protein|nr:hypothetical protein [Thermoguttaceae bacterium]